MQDRLTIGVSQQQKEFVQMLVDDLGLFAQNMDAAKFAMALALRLGLSPEEAKGAETAWAVGNFDPDGAIRSLVETLMPETTSPYRHVEALIQAGLEIMQRQFSQTSDLNVGKLLSLDVGTKKE